MFPAFVTEDWEEPEATPEGARASAATSSPKGKKPSKPQAGMKEDADTEHSSDGSDEYMPEDKAPKVRFQCPIPIPDVLRR